MSQIQTPGLELLRRFADLLTQNYQRVAKAVRVGIGYASLSKSRFEYFTGRANGRPQYRLHPLENKI
jgi:hypothetical protein